MATVKSIIDKSVGIVADPIKVREGDDKNAIIKEAVLRATEAYDYWKDNLDRAEQDVAFIFGEQYSRQDLEDKELENRVALTFNKLPQFINKVTGAQRSIVQSIKVSPTGGSIGTDEPEMETGKGDNKKLSQVLSDLIRDIEYQSNAVSGYKMAFKHALEGGFGWVRVLTEYQDNGFNLDIKIKGIRDRWSVLVDPKATEQDMSDMNYAFISETMSVEEFNKRYPNKSKEALPNADNYDHTTFWQTQDSVTVSEYFRREPITKEISLLSNGEVYDSKDVEPVLAELEEMGITVLKKRKTKTYKTIWCKISQGDILEEEIEFPTSTIPLAPVTGRETDFRRSRQLKGLVNDAIDAQQALNTMRSAALERIDASPISPFIATDKAIEGYEDMWAEANTTKYSTLVYRKGEEMPRRDQGATVPVAEMQITGVLDEDMKGSIGIFNASLGATSNEISGKAIQARQSEADVGTFEFLDNYNNMIRRIGLLCVELIPKIYDTERIIRIRGIDGESDTIEINKVVQDNESGDEVVINALNFGEHTVVVGSGASYETKREENAGQILDLMKVNPQVAQVGSDLLVKNLDFSESDVLAERLTKMVPLNLLSKEKQEEIKKDAPPPQPSPEQIKVQAEQQKLQVETDMKKLELESKVELEKIKLEIAQTNLAIKKLDMGNAANQDIRNAAAQEEVRKTNIAKSIADKIKNKAPEQANNAESKDAKPVQEKLI